MQLTNRGGAEASESPDGRVVYFTKVAEIGPGLWEVPVLRFYDFLSRRARQLGTVENTVKWTNTPGFAISPDGRWVLYTSLESTDADLMLVDNFR